jgi:hypothetical protein
VVTVIIPGYAPHNKTWLEETAKQLGDDDDIRPIYWDHWKEPGARFDAKEQGQHISSITQVGSCDIVAKSIGTLVASYLILQDPSDIHKVIFCGIPMNDLSEADKAIIKTALKSIPPEQVLCIQNDEDPHGTTDQLVNFLSSFDSDVKVESKTRIDHEYPFVDDFKKFLLG